MQGQLMSTTSFCSQCGAPLTQGALFCSKCGASVNTANSSASVPLQPVQKPKPKSFLQKEIVSQESMNAGCLSIIMWAGFLGAASFLMFFDTSVSSSLGRVNNIGLMQENQNWILFCGAVGFIALIVKVTKARK